MTAGVCPVCGGALESVACTGLRGGCPRLDTVRIHADETTCILCTPPRN